MRSDVVGCHGEHALTYDQSLFVGALTSSEIVPWSKPQSDQWLSRKRYQALQACSDVLKRRPFSLFIFVFVFTGNTFTFFAFTREDVLSVEIEGWHKRGPEVFGMMQFLLHIPLDCLLGQPKFSTQPDHADLAATLQGCSALGNLDSPILMLAQNNRDFGRSTAVYDLGAQGILKIVHLAVAELKASAEEQAPAPTEVITMKHLANAFGDSRAPTHLKDFESRFPALVASVASPRLKYSLAGTRTAPQGNERQLWAILMSGSGSPLDRTTIKGVVPMFRFFIDVFQSEAVSATLNR